MRRLLLSLGAPPSSSGSSTPAASTHPSGRRTSAVAPSRWASCGPAVRARTASRRSTSRRSCRSPARVPERPPASVSSGTEVARPSSPRTRRELRDLRAQGGRVVDDDVLARLARLRGAPVVVNVWASWCPNCRDEFKYFKRSSEEYEGKVAFLGLDSNDDRGAAEEFLAEFPVPYPSIDDPDAEQARSIGAGVGWPTTIFYGADGKRRFVRQGGYVSQEALDEDIRTYAVG